MRRALMAGELSEFGRLLDEAWQFKKRVSNKISNSVIDEIYRLARQKGALGGKITGAGGGGFMLLYCEQRCQQAVRQVFAERALPEMRFEFEFQGAQVIANDPFLDGDEGCGLRWNLVWNQPFGSCTRSVKDSISALVA
jgi:D-glycero-alpha-D-manno-heptose-7-phosphate kinase